jgi:hypothetical protein
MHEGKKERVKGNRDHARHQDGDLVGPSEKASGHGN